MICLVATLGLNSQKFCCLGGWFDANFAYLCVLGNSFPQRVGQLGHTPKMRIIFKPWFAPRWPAWRTFVRNFGNVRKPTLLYADMRKKVLLFTYLRTYMYYWYLPTYMIVGNGVNLILVLWYFSLHESQFLTVSMAYQRNLIKFRLSEKHKWFEKIFLVVLMFSK